MSEKLSIVHVQWQDPGFARTGWMDKAEFQEFASTPIYQTDTAGFLTFESDEYLVVSMNIGHSEIAQSTKILRRAIIKMTVLQEIDIDSEVMEWAKKPEEKPQ